MSEIKTEIKPNADGSYTITDAHSTADIVRWLLTQDSKETILYLLNEGLAQPEQEPTRSQKMRDEGITRRPKGWDKEKHMNCKHDWLFVDGVTKRLRCRRCGAYAPVDSVGEKS